MVDRDALLGLVAGLAGLAFGVAAAVMNVAGLAVVAAACALVAGGASVVLVRRLHDAERDLAGATALMKLVDLPAPAREEARSLVDPETSLPDRQFFDLAVEGRVAAARRHLWPVTIVLLEIGLDDLDGRHRREAAVAFTGIMRRTLREADVACRLGPTTFGLVLEDTSEEGGVWTAERLQIALARDPARIKTLAAGVAGYPTHGLRADEVLVRAREALRRACSADPGRGLGQVEVAQADLA
ncbi:MAG TPA: diguanylate cyclase [Acidimicrobiales bacterium]|jgi:diguanylate cyclase (GGDEF)-like protein|nr:diguanylate cyclase [Acidimicrobiales bacterium]